MICHLISLEPYCNNFRGCRRKFFSPLHYTFCWKHKSKVEAFPGTSGEKKLRGNIWSQECTILCLTTKSNLPQVFFTSIFKLLHKPSLCVECLLFFVSRHLLLFTHPPKICFPGSLLDRSDFFLFCCFIPILLQYSGEFVYVCTYLLCGNVAMIPE